MPGMFGSSAKMAVRRPGGDIGFTSKRRHNILTRMGIPLDAQGRIISGGGGAGLQPFGGGANPWGTPMFGGGGGGGNPFGALGMFMPGMLMAHAGGGMSPYMNPFLAYGLRQQQPAWPTMPTITGLPGEASTDGGSRGPAPNPFNALNRFSGPSGNGGGAILPNMQNPMMAW